MKKRPSLVSDDFKKYHQHGRSKYDPGPVDRFAARGFPRPQGMERWVGMSPAIFLAATEQGGARRSLKPGHIATAYTVTPKGVPARVRVIPAYAPGYAWVLVQLSLPANMGGQMRRKVLDLYYPAVTAEEDLEAALKLWGFGAALWHDEYGPAVVGLRWETHATAFQPLVTYFDISVDERAIILGTGGLVIRGRHKLAKAGETDVEWLRLSVCRIPQHKMEEKLERSGAHQSPDVILRAGGKVYEATPKTLARIAKSAGKHFKKYIIDGKRNLMAPYMEGTTDGTQNKEDDFDARFRRGLAEHAVAGSGDSTATGLAPEVPAVPAGRSGVAAEPAGGSPRPSARPVPRTR